ncbi:hypothetical protein NL676_007179 [Syzygium grande]|nr:hypothetical protein NL676_007179 [Syzygium grande]
MKKWRVRIPDDPKELYELSIDEYASSGRLRIDNTPTLRFFDKAATKTGPTSSWILCTVTQVEEAKQIFKMVPILIATFVPSGKRHVRAGRDPIHQAGHNPGT